MNRAESTWALIVGIDEYDDPDIGRLTGAALDAVKAAGWLRRLGVPDSQILLHVAPCEASKQRVADLGLEAHEARESDLRGSLLKLEQAAIGGAERLFVVLSGHGIYEPETRRLFLVQDFSEKAPLNMGLDGHIEYFRSLQFAEQYLLFDGCLNYPYPTTARKRLEATRVLIPGRAGFTPRPDNSLVACFAASQGQRAHEVDGKSLFLHRLLEALDPERPEPSAVRLDFETGERTVDLAAAFFRIQSQVRSISAERGLPQTPALHPYGKGASRPSHPIIRLPELPTAQLELGIEPAEAARDIERMRLWSRGRYPWERRLEKVGDDAIDLPFRSRVPVGEEFEASCDLSESSTWKVRRQSLELSVGGDVSRKFSFAAGDEAVEPRGATVVRVVLPDGGPQILAGCLVDAPSLWAGPPRPAPPDSMWRGFDDAISLASLRDSSEFEVEPGPVQVRLRLPWGSWERNETLAEGERKLIELPSTLGAAPLRTRLYREVSRKDGAILGIDGEAPPARSRPIRGESAARPLKELDSGSAAWALAAPGSLRLVELGDPPWALFPSSRGITLAVDRSHGQLRVEPLSSSAAPEWDLLLGAGQLDALPPEQSAALIAEADSDPLLGIAGAYTAYGARRWKDLGTFADLERGGLLGYLGKSVLKGRLRRLSMADIMLLTLAYRLRDGGPPSEGQVKLLSGLAGTIPLLRWGVGLALDLLGSVESAHRTPKLQDWGELLLRIQAGLSPTSVWTAWTWTDTPVGSPAATGSRRS